ncbi:unnamed protein product [Clonostachys rhizophaga]|uniref:Major facilitator superfamily (MFS) profile domain-containing protein n=1 Tax=Clonostachys rhizophaga TaxID=160324 RepID=A0A9N9VF82_9HYPO|nr:unnamed protein product [Clonostachys rhizophaga]
MTAKTVTTTVAVSRSREDVPPSQFHVPEATSSSSSSSSSQEHRAKFSKFKKVLTTAQLSVVNFTTSACNGMVVVALPAMTVDLHLPKSLAFWPASTQGLATASSLLLMASVADAIGPKWVDICGCLLCGFTMVGAGLIRTGEQLLAMRALSGVGLAMHLCSSVSILTKILDRGRPRNLAFASLGLSQVLGFSFGLVTGGIFVDSLGWRAGWYIYAGVTMLFTFPSLWTVPGSKEKGTPRQRIKNLTTTVDWVGAILGSTFMASLCYFLAVLSTDVERIHNADAIVCLCLAAVSCICFIFWMHIQVKAQRPALIPNSLWRNHAFSTICATVALSYANMGSMELFASLFFQEVQQLSALEASIRLLPSFIVAAFLNVGVGMFVHKVPVIWLVVGSSLLCALAPLLMAVIQPEWTYWANAFVAQLFQPISADILSTIGLIIITDSFPDDTQALAGAVFNTAGQFGTAFGLAVLQVVSQQVSMRHDDLGKVNSIMEGYRASFWTMVGFMVLCAALGGAGMRRVGKVGLKRD